jgi:hypothetical protein
MATLKRQQTEQDVRQKAVKAFREVGETQEALTTAQEMAGLRKEAAKKAKAPEALMAAARASMLAEVDVVKAELAYRQAYVQLMVLTGNQDCPVVGPGHGNPGAVLPPVPAAGTP